MNVFEFLKNYLVQDATKNANGRNIAKHLALVFLIPKNSFLHSALNEPLLKLGKWCEKEDHPIEITSTFRTFKEQDILYQKGRTSPGSKITNAKGGESYHNYGLAADFKFVKDPHYPPSQSFLWKKVGQKAEELGLEWGGRWGDNPHLQYGEGKGIDWRILKAYFEGDSV